jgi:hypothetical protein
MDATKDEGRKKGPGEATGDGEARHGYRNEVSWDGGEGRQPYTNRGDVEQGTDAMPEAEAGNEGEVAGRNVEQLREVKEKPDRPVRQSPREA